MKNAMKKLMSVLLVAVLLISAVPFAASADEEFDLSGMNVKGAARSVDNGETSFASAQSVSGEALGKTQVVLIFDGVKDDNRWANIADNTNVKSLLIQMLGSDATNSLMAKYRLTSHTGDWNAVVSTGDYLEISFATRTFAVNVGFNGSTASWYKDVKYGESITLDENLITNANLSLGADYKLDFFKVGDKNYNVGDTIKITAATTIYAVKKAANSSSTTTPTTPNTSSKLYVDVILNEKTSNFGTGDYYRCYLVEGRITTADRNAVAAKIDGKLFNGKKIVAWMRDNGQTASSLVDFNFSDLTSAINILPVFQAVETDPDNGSTNNTSKQYTVTFYDYDGKTVLHTAKTTNGKITYVDANYAALQVSSVSGYTFAERWKKNGSGESIATSTIVSELTFTADTYFTPVYNKTSSSTVTSSKNLNDIILNIFVNEDFSSPAKTIKLNTSFPAVLDDDTISLTEIKNSVVATYYSAKDTTKGLLVDGMYYTTGSFMYNWLTDNEATKTSTISGVAAKRAEGTVCINVMVTNAVAKSTTSTADSSNPKTGDSIYTAMTVMGISAASLAAVMYIYNKKRQAI